MSEAVVPQVSFHRLARHSLLFGVPAGLAAGLWLVMVHSFDWRHAALQIAILVFPIAGMVLGVTRWRNDAFAGRFRFAHAFAATLAIGFIYVFTFAVVAWAHATAFAPHVIDGILARQAEMLAQAGKTVEEIATWKEEIRPLATPASYAYGILLQTLLPTLFVALIASLTVPKTRPGLEPPPAKAPAE